MSFSLIGLTSSIFGLLLVGCLASKYILKSTNFYWVLYSLFAQIL